MMIYPTIDKAWVENANLRNQVYLPPSLYNICEVVPPLTLRKPGIGWAAATIFSNTVLNTVWVFSPDTSTCTCWKHKEESNKVSRHWLNVINSFLTPASCFFAAETIVYLNFVAVSGLHCRNQNWFILGRSLNICREKNIYMRKEEAKTTTKGRENTFKSLNLKVLHTLLRTVYSLLCEE